MPVPIRNIITEPINDQDTNEARQDEIRVEDTPYGFDRVNGRLALSIGNLTIIKFIGLLGNPIELAEEFNSILPHIYDKDEFGISILHMACLGGHTNFVRYLINGLGFDPNDRDNYGRTPFHYAVCSMSLELVRYLYEEAHANPSIRDNAGHSAIWYSELLNSMRD